MKTKLLTFLLSFLFLFSGSVFGDYLQDAKDASKRKDYKEAVKWYRLSAEQGDRNAQHNLGLMYDKGQGVPQDYKETVKWFRLSAEQGYATAQFTLGLMYYQGKGVPQDYVSAHMWMNLSGSNGHEGGVKGRNALEKKMTPSQLEEAQRLARNWKQKK